MDKFFLNICRQGCGNTIRIDNICIISFRFQKNLMTGAISKLHQFVLYTWAITRSYTCYKSGKKCTFRKIITNNLMRLFIRVGYIAFDLRLRYFFGHKRKRYRRCITFLFIQNIPFNCFSV